ncbi:MAG: sulfotransferase [Alphaproteobacteria bacterium]|nr:sulfotransferase [Alphaproteobacteria bacterium]
MTLTRQETFARLAKAEKAGDTAEYKAILEAAVVEFQDDPVIVAQHARLLYMSGEKDRAAKQFVRAVNLTRGQYHVRMAICDTIYEVGLQKLASQCLPKLADVETVNESFARIKILRSQKDKVSVGKCCDHLVRTATMTSDQWKQISGLAGVAGRAPAAIKAFVNSLEGRAPDSKEILNLVFLCIKNDDLDSAENWLAQAPAETKDDPNILTARAICLRKRGKTDEAVQAYRALIAVNPLANSAWQGLSELVTKEELPPLAEQIEDILAKEELSEIQQRSFQYDLGRMYERIKETDKAFAAYREANNLYKGLIAASGREYRPEKMELVRQKQLGMFADFSPEELARGSGFSAQTPIFIVGMPRSGTTLLERMLGAIPSVAMGGEDPALVNVVNEYAYEIVRRRAKPPAKMTEAVWQGLAESYWTRALVHGRHVINKLPQNFRWAGWIMKMFPDAPIIYLERDPMDIGWSIYKRPMLPDFNFAVDQEFLAHAIKECREYIAGWSSQAPDRILRVRFEDLVSDPEANSRRIVDFCGLEWTPACLEPEKLDTPTFTISEQQVRAPINQKGIGRWQAYSEHLKPMAAKLKEYGVTEG